MILLSFGFFLFLFVAIGVLSTLKNKRTNIDYLLASHNIKPWLVALSAVATNNSGYMFVGMIGFAYVSGLSVIWMMIGALIGDFTASLLVHKKLRIVSQKQHALSFPEALSKWNGNDYKILRICGAIIVVIFLSIYAAAQLSAGGKALHVLFGFDYKIGSIIGAIMVLLYCFAGGIRASIWTDAAQSFVMIIAMAVLFYSSLNYIGGFNNFIFVLNGISPTYLDIFPPNLPFGNFGGPALFLIGWFFGGYGIVGQPHIMVRFMAMNKPENMMKIRYYYYSWYFGFFSLTIASGLAARVLIPFQAGFDPELALPTLAHLVLPEILVGLILAGLFSATMSTADSQILSCSASITNDLLPAKKNNYFYAKLSTILVTSAALIVSLTDNQSVFALVMIAWLAVACAFSPIITIYALGGKISEKLALIMMFSGFITMLIWRHFGLGYMMYEAAPGILAGILPYLISKIYKKIKT